MASTTSAIRKPPIWLSYWFAFSTVIVLWDAGYCFMRPRSMPGGDLAWIWAPYNMVPYADVDFVYGWKVLEAGDGFTNAQALMNVFEAILNVEYLYLRHFSSRTVPRSSGQREHSYHGHAPIVGFATAVMTCAKTTLYFWQDYYCNWCSSGHNSRRYFWQYYIAPNVTWIVMPAIVAIVLGRFISAALNREYASQVAYEEAATIPRPSARSTRTSVPSEIIVGRGASGCKSKSRSRSRRATAGGGGAAGARSSSVATIVPPSIGQSNAAPSSSSSTTTPFPPTAELPFLAPVSGAGLPLTFRPTGLTCLVIGTNRLAATRGLGMLEADAKVIVISEQDLDSASEEIRYRVGEGQMSFERIPAGQDWKELFTKHEAALVCVTDTLIGTNKRSDISTEAIAQAAESLRMPINISDHPTLSTFAFPSVHRFDGVAGPSSLQIAVSTNAKGCRLSTRIKRDIVTRLPRSIGAAVDNVGLLRDHAKSMEVSDDDVETPLNSPVPQLDTPSLLSQASDLLSLPLRDKDKEKEGDQVQLRRMRWVHQMSEYYSYDALARITADEMEGALSTWRGGALPHHEGGGSGEPVVKALANGNGSGSGRIYLVGSGPGHPGLLTVAALHVFRTADVVLSDKLVPSEILALIPSTTRVHIAKKFPGNNEGAQNEMMQLALEAAQRGNTVVRLKQGDPFVYGRGGEEVLYFRQNGFEAAVIPGVSSALAGPLMMGIPVTQRGVAESMILCTGVGRAGKAVRLPGYVRSRTLALLMGVARIGQIVEVLTGDQQEGREGEAYPRHLPIAIIERASSPDQRAILSTLENIEQALKSMEERPPGMMLIGWAALALEGKGRVDVLDRPEEVGEEEGYVREWLVGKRWKVREGLEEGWQALEGVVQVQ